MFTKDLNILSRNWRRRMAVTDTQFEVGPQMDLQGRADNTTPAPPFFDNVELFDCRRNETPDGKVWKALHISSTEQLCLDENLTGYADRGIVNRQL
jgi:hypothetical protein